MVSPPPVALPLARPPLPPPPQSSTIPPLPQKAPTRPPHTSILCSPAQPKNIPLNTVALESICNLMVTVDTPQNLHPWNSGNGVKFTSIAIFHRDPSVNPGVNMYRGLKKVFEMLLHTDPRSDILPLYADEAGVAIARITTITAYPADVLGLGNYVQISNPYTLSKIVGKDGEGNPRPQRPTYVYMRISTNLLFSHVVGLIQPTLNQIEVNLKEKEMPYLDTKTRYAFVGTTNDWCSDALQAIHVNELIAHIEVL